MLDVAPLGLTVFKVLFPDYPIEFYDGYTSTWLGGHTMRITTLVLSVFLAGSLVLCAFLTYLLIDRSITLSYVNSSMDSEVRSRVVIAGLIKNEWYGKKESEIYQKLKVEIERNPSMNIVMKKTEKGIDFDNFSFNFENGKLKSIE